MTSKGEDGKMQTENSQQKNRIIKIAAVLGIAVLIGFMAKNHFESDAAATKANMQPPAPAVILYTVSEKNLSPSRSFVGKVEAIQSVSLKPQVAGEIKRVNFKEGSLVKAGQILFTIDNSQYQATVDLRKAELQQAEAALIKAEKYFARVKASDKRSISASDIDTAESAFLQAKAGVSQAKAVLKLAEIDLSHTRIISPITGQIGEATYTKGNYVTPASGGLASIVQMDPIRVSFAITDKDYLNQLEQFKKNGPVYQTSLVLSNGRELNIQGQRDFESNKVDERTGTLEMVIRFPNPEGILIPGSMVRIGTKPIDSDLSLIVPQESILADSQGNYVYTVDEKNIAHQTRIELGEEVGTMRKVVKGLKADDRVIRIGLQNVRPEAPVSPTQEETGNKTAAELAGQSEEELSLTQTDSHDKEGN
ncbi:MAG: efflux RND transporter periplasmic adaptor subunit [Synergistaceae bacterium]|nr:efflux RND transporter periplasmic adaptor subunit [Synergistaceae bacterium]